MKAHTSVQSEYSNLKMIAYLFWKKVNLMKIFILLKLHTQRA